MDVRHPLQPLDLMMLEMLMAEQLPVHILLTKADKLSKSSAIQALRAVKKELENVGLSQNVQLFSVQQPHTLTEVIDVFDEWLDMPKLITE